MATATLTKPNNPVNADETTPSSGLSAARFVLDQLSAWGVERIYGVIGDGNLYFLDEIPKQGRIEYIACRHEEAAALMACAEAKLTGRIGVCLATSGPGMVNLLNGLADAQMDSTPVLAITGQVDTKKIGTPTKQYINQQMMSAPIVSDAQSVQIGSPDSLPDVLLRLLTTSTVQGSVSHLTVPKDLWQQPVKGKVTPYRKHLHQPLLAPESVIREAASSIAQAAKPVLYAGRGVKGMQQELVELAELLQAPVVVTMPSKDVFPNGHRLFAGGLGQGGSEASSIILDESDLIVMLGTSWWPEEYAPKHANMIQFDIAAEQIGQGHPLSAGVVGDLKHALPLVLEDCRRAASGVNRSSWAKRTEEIIGQWNDVLKQELNLDGSPIAPQRIMKILSDVCDEDAVLCVDTGDHTLWFGRAFEAKRHDILLSGMWRTLGFALPAAIAAKRSAPGRQVVAIVGDGGAVQTLLELKTAAQYQVPLVLIILNNGSYAMEKNRMEQAGLNTLGSLLHNPDFVGVAEACGAKGYKVTSPAELEKTLRQALQENGPVVLDVATADTMVPHTSI
ncbi:thiamine pyrophosphate-binding protein [Paenibacillus turpanensis]|uniref:thiamine pyrophosphate-binding protein n=1 Tax=Paenibacillus turpanensis TaxID=2689078 RepID=UPI00140DFAE2|nr:thiamine pyrophosphate-binding protein [Paenibacillus turpanensis]